MSTVTGRFLVIVGAALLGLPLGADTPFVHDGHFDGLVFDLKMGGTLTPGDASTYGSVANAMTWRAASRTIATAVTTFDPAANPTKTTQFGTPEPVEIQSIATEPATYHWTSPQPTESVLHFPQPMRSYTDPDSGVTTTNIFPQCVTMPVVDAGSNVTYYVRFRWDGNLRDSYEQCIFDNGMTWLNGEKKGYGFALACYEVGHYEDQTTCNLRMKIGGDNYNYATYPQLTRGKWYELVVRMTVLPDGSGTKLDLAVGIHKMTNYHTIIFATNRKTYTDRYTVPKYDGATPRGKLYIGSGVTSATTWQARNSTSGNSFRGVISALQIYNRALTDEEIRALLYRSDGNEIAAGSVNGKADEFAATEAETASVYEPLTMPAQRMRGTLDAAHPELTVKFPMYKEEEGLPRVLRVTPVLTGLAASVPVQVSVNGRRAARADLAKADQRDIFLRQELMTRDADGNVTVTLRRAGSADLPIDAFKLSGSWAWGKTDKKNNDWCFRDYSSIIQSDASYYIQHRALVGAPYGMACTASSVNGQKNTSTDVTADGYMAKETLMFDVPASVAALPSTYTVGVVMTDYSYGKFTVKLNDVLVGEEVRPSAAGEFAFDFAPGTLQAGLNRITIQNTSINARGEDTPPQYNVLSFDSHRFTFTPPPPPPQGMAIFIQ